MAGNSKTKYMEEEVKIIKFNGTIFSDTQIQPTIERQTFLNLSFKFKGKLENNKYQVTRMIIKYLKNMNEEELSEKIKNI